MRRPLALRCPLDGLARDRGRPLSRAFRCPSAFTSHPPPPREVARPGRAAARGRGGGSGRAGARCGGGRRRSAQTAGAGAAGRVAARCVWGSAARGPPDRAGPGGECRGRWRGPGREGEATRRPHLRSRARMRCGSSPPRFFPPARSVQGRGRTAAACGGWEVTRGPRRVAGAEVVPVDPYSVADSAGKEAAAGGELCQPRSGRRRGFSAARPGARPG